MAWDKLTWKWLRKHEPLPAHYGLEKIKESTEERGSASKFLRGIIKEEFEEFAEKRMRLIRATRTEQFFYVIFDRDIGISAGILTRIARVRWHIANDIHAYPVTADEILRELQRENGAEYDRFKDGG